MVDWSDKTLWHAVLAGGSAALRAFLAGVTLA